MNTATMTLTAAALAVGLATTGAEVAFADQTGVRSDIGTYKVNDMLNKTSSKGHNTAQRLGYCVVGNNGATCEVTRSASVTRTIGVDLGLTRSFVASKLNISSGATVGVSVSCKSPALRKGQTWSAYPTGTHYSYKMRSRTYRDTGKLISDHTSGTLKAFNPNGGISCMVK
jgi:hypothetical protein